MTSDRLTLTTSFGFAKFETIEQGVACIMALSQVGYQCSFAKVRALGTFDNLDRSLSVIV